MHEYDRIVGHRLKCKTQYRKGTQVSQKVSIRLPIVLESCMRLMLASTPPCFPFCPTPNMMDSVDRKLFCMCTTRVTRLTRSRLQVIGLANLKAFLDAQEDSQTMLTYCNAPSSLPLHWECGNHLFLSGKLFSLVRRSRGPLQSSRIWRSLALIVNGALQ